MDQPFLKIYEEKYDLTLERIYRTLSAFVFNPNEPNNYFENDTPLAVFILEGVVFCNQGKVVEIEHSFYRGDKYRFSIDTKPQLIEGSY